MVGGRFVWVVGGRFVGGGAGHWMVNGGRRKARVKGGVGPQRVGPQRVGPQRKTLQVRRTISFILSRFIVIWLPLRWCPHIQQQVRCKLSEVTPNRQGAHLR